MTSAAIYARYSSDLQRDASIEDQIRLCKERAKREGWRVVNCYTDHAISGASLIRPGMQMLLQDAQAGKVRGDRFRSHRPAVARPGGYRPYLQAHALCRRADRHALRR